MSNAEEVKAFHKAQRANFLKSQISLDGMVFGMPPRTHVSDAVMESSMPTAIITPCEPEFSKGLSLFHLDPDKGFKAYQAILETVGFTITSKSIKVAYLADNFPTDTFNNEYGETFLDKFAQVASSGLGDLSQIMGWTSFSDMTKQMGDLADNTGKAGAMARGLVDTAKEYEQKTTAGMSGRNQNLINSMKNTMMSIATGARVDFPQVWKNSSYTPSYSMTIRLYNPDPSDPAATRKYIVGPIAALVALGIPKVAEDSSTYKWPLLCKVRSEGIYHLNAAYINSIAVIKGGDQQSIAYNQALGMVDVRIDFGSLYNSMLAGGNSNLLSPNRPTLGSYLEGIGGKSVTTYQTTKQATSKSDGPESPAIPQVKLQEEQKPNQSKSATKAPGDSVDSRTDDDDEETTTELTEETSSDFYDTGDEMLSASGSKVIGLKPTFLPDGTMIMTLMTEDELPK